VAAVALLGLLGSIVSTFGSSTAGAITTSALFVVLVGLGLYALRERARIDGPYELVRGEVTWDLPDAAGDFAVSTKRLVYRFGQQTFAIPDWNSTDGQATVADVDGGNVAGELTIGNRQVVLVALDPPRRRGEEATIQITRELRAAFTAKQESVGIDSLAREGYVVKVLFPEGRPAPRAVIRSGDETRSIGSGDSAFQWIGDRHS
jgi:hypothetical protein